MVNRIGLMMLCATWIGNQRFEKSPLGIGQVHPQGRS